MSTAQRNAPPPEFQISNRANEIPEALSIYINQIVYDLKRHGRDIISLSLGEAFFDIPMFDFKKLDADKCAHYSDTQGIPELRRKISDFYNKYYGAPVDPDNEMMITAGSKIAIFMAMQGTLNQGDEVLIHEPAWLSYQEQARLVGAVPKFIPFACPPEEFDHHFSERTRMLIINNPNNPAGRVYTRAELVRIVEVCREHGIYVLVDEAYSDFLINETFVSMATVAPNKEGVIIVNSLSKNMGLSGWRIGYVITSPDLLKVLIKLNQHLITCAPSILVYYLEQYFDQIIGITLPQVRAVVEKRARIEKMIDGIGLTCLKGGATFYFFVSIDGYPGTSLDLAMQLLLTKGVAVVPGSAYGASTERFVRVSIGTESEERIWEALKILRDVIDSRELDLTETEKIRENMGIRHFQ